MENPVLDRVARAATLLDFSRAPTTRGGWGVRVVALCLGFAVLGARVKSATRPMLAAPAPAPVPADGPNGERFGVPLAVRRAVFADLAVAERAERKRAVDANTWNGHAWSREDDRGWYERVAVRGASAKYGLSLTQVYLVLDEGIRERWPDANGVPLPATTPPFDPRTGW